MKKAYILLIFLLLAASFFLGCGELEDDAVATYPMTIWPPSAVLNVGDEFHFYAVMGSSDGTVSQVEAEFSITGSIGSISSDGLFTAEAVGVGSVIALYGGSTASISVEVE